LVVEVVIVRRTFVERRLVVVQVGDGFHAAYKDLIREWFEGKSLSEEWRERALGTVKRNRWLCRF
jgi:hypothetical protein